MKLKLITVPNPLLRQKSLPIAKVDKEVTQFLNDLAETLLKKSDPPGVGLSAVQVGQLLRAFYVYMPPIYDLDSMSDGLPASELKLFLNPEIISASKDMTLGPDPDNPALEGCLSVPALYGPVPRHQSITVKYLTLKSDSQPVSQSASHKSKQLTNSLTNCLPNLLIEKTDTFANFYARVIQHEYDHLEGILFTDHTQQDHQKLYFDQGDKLVPIPKPNQIIQW